MNSTESSGNPNVLTFEEYYQLQDAIFWLEGVFYSIVGLIGVAVNIFNIIALSRTTKTAAYKIFLAMAVSDLMLMLVILTYAFTFCVYDPPKIELGKPPNLEKGITYSMYLWNNFWFHAVNIFACVSNWCTVLLAVFRLIATLFPLKAHKYASKERVNGAIVAVYVLSLAGQIFGWQAYRFNTHGAIIVNTLSKRYINVSVVIGGPLPLILCTLATVVLILQLAMYQRKIKASISKQQLANRWKAHKSLTVTLILVLSLFVITTLPSTVYWTMENTGFFDANRVSIFKKNIFLLVASTCSLIQPASNFFIYVCTNKAFRDNLLKAICFHKRSSTINISSIRLKTSTRLESSTKNSEY